MVAPAFNLSVLAPYNDPSWRPSVLGTAGVTQAANLLTAQPGEKAVLLQDSESGGVFSSSVDFDLQTTAAVTDQVAVLYHDFPSTAYAHLYFSNSSAFDVIIDSVLNVPLTAEGGYANNRTLRPLGYRHGLWSRIGQPVTARYLRIVFVTPTSADVKVGRVMIGRAIQPEFNSDYGDTSWGYQTEEPELLDSGVEVLVEHTPAPEMEFRLSWLKESEMQADWEPLSRLAVQGEPVLVCRRPDPHPYRHSGMFYGRLRLNPIVAADFDMYEVTGKIRSMV